MLWSALAAGLWGGLYVVSQLAFGNHLPPATLSLVRLVIGVLALLAVMRSWPRLREGRVALLGAILAVTLLVQAVGTYLSGAATGSLLTLMTPVFVALLAPLFLQERTRPLQWLGIGLGIAGAAVVIGPAGAGSPLGDVLLVLASLTWALFTVLGGHLVRARGSLAVTAAAATWAVPFTAVAAAVELAAGARPAINAAGAGEVLYLGLGATALGWWAWYRGVEGAPAAAVAVPFLLQPVVGVGLSAAFLGAHLSVGFAAGSVLVAAGMLVASLKT
ncbi:MAG TPA: DMT family transporter [Candidatus Dormibacteraeota bacterium]